MKEGHDGFCVRSASLGCGTMSVESVGFHIYLIIKKKNLWLEFYQVRVDGCGTVLLIERSRLNRFAYI